MIADSIISFLVPQFGQKGGSDNAASSAASNTASNNGGGSAASFEGQACTDGTFDGTCDDTGRCGLEIPPNELSSQIVSGQCGS